MRYAGQPLKGHALPLLLRGRAAVLFTVALTTLCVVAALILLAGGRSVTRRPLASIRTVASTGLSSLPLLAEGPVSAVLGKADRAYRFHDLVALNPAQRIGLRLAHGTVELSSGNTRIALGLRAFGRGGSLTDWGPEPPLVVGNRVSYANKNVREWFVNGPVGVEQGFDVARRPAGSGPLTFAIALTGNVVLRPAGRSAVLLQTGGHAALRYAGLSAIDARGHQLPAWLGLDRGRLSLYVDDRGAHYPVTVDPFIQQGAKLVATGESGDGEFGTSVTLASDGNTALIGAPDDGSDGAAYVFVRSDGMWTQQSKLVGTGEDGSSVEEGSAVALSADGNTALIGAPSDDGGVGAAWVFVRSNGAWTQDQKITEANAGANAEFGYSVALSGDGDTALVGARDADNEDGAAWVFANSDGTWSQQGGALVPSDASNPAVVGTAVALSSDGSTALIGGPGNDDGVGAAWVFVQSDGSWTQQGDALVGSGTAGTDGSEEGHAVALSSDGDTALIGGPDDNDFVGASWVFVRSDGTWSQEGSKLVGSTTASTEQQGVSVALTGDGDTALIGEPHGAGGAFVFTLSDGTWTQQGGLLSGTGGSGTPEQGTSAALSSDGTTALLGGPIDDSLVGAAWAFGNAPAVSGVNPSSGPTSGGTTVTITGTGFTGATAVNFGSQPATSFTVNGDTQITATAPAGTGIVDVTVTTGSGTSATSTADQYGYGGCTDEFSPQSGDDWGTAANWSEGTVPTSSDVACWPAGTTVVVSGSDSSATAASLQGGALTISGGTLTLAGTSASTVGNFTESSGSLNGPGALGLSGAFSWTGGVISQTQDIAITQTGGGTFSISGTSQAYLTGGSISTSSPVSISNTDFIAADAATLTTTGTVTFGAGSYTNNGANLTITAAGFITTGAISIPDYNLDLDGTASSLGGSLTAPALSSATRSSLTIPSGDTVSVAGGTINGTITGAGTFTQTGGTVTIASGGTLSTSDVALTAGTLNVNSGATYAAGAATTISGDTVNILPTSATTGSLTETAGELNGPGALALSGNFSWTGGSISATQAISITQPAGQTFSITGTNQAYLAGGSISTQSPVSISNTGFIAADAATLTTTSTVTFAPGNYTNNGANLTITAAGFITTGTTSIPDYNLDLDGTTSNLGGSLTAPALSSTAGSSLTVPSGDTVSVAGGTLNGTVTGAGTLTQTGGTLTLASGGTLSTSGVSISGGTLTVNSGAGYSAGGATTINGGTLNITPTGATTGSLTETAGELNGPGALALSGNFSWTGGSISATQAISITQPAGQTFSITGTNQAYLAGGSISTQSPVSISNTDFIDVDGPTLTTTSTVTFTPGSYTANGGPSLTISAAGFVTSGNTSLPDYTLVQTGGTTAVAGGTTLSSGPFTLEGGVVDDDGTVEATTSLTGGTLKGTGVIEGSLTNTSGTVTPGDSGPGTLNVTENYSQGSAGTLQVAINGTAAGDFSQLNVNGDLTLNGTLALIPSASYANSAQPGDKVGFLPYAASLTGEFASTTVNPALADGATISPNYSISQIVDAVVGAPPAPTVAGLNPTEGPANGGTSVTITGTHLTGATAVKFGTNSGTNVSVVNSTTVTATSPAGNAGTVNVTVTTPGGTSATSSADQYTYVSAPTVSGISPTAGPTAGGTRVTITGTNLTGATAVKFGSDAATNLNVVNSTTITATSPAGAAGTVDVTVTTPGGTSATSAADHYTYAAAPTISGLNPSTGPTTGGTTVTITGTNLLAATAVSFGPDLATNVNVVSPTTITATSPAEGVGTVDVTATTPGGTSVTGAPDHYTYVTPAPTVTGLNPTSGPTGGGTTVTITGTNLTGATAVEFGTNAATNVSVVNPTTIAATSPAGNGGTVDVTVTTPGGTSATSAADQFTYSNSVISSSLPPTPAPPSVTGGAPTVETSSGAALSGTVNPEGATTTAYFEYGLDPSERGPGSSTTLYDQSTPVQSVGSDSTTHTITAALSGLVPGELYHVRIVATNSSGTSFGSDETFTTAPAPAPSPVLGQSENVQPVSGTVFIRLPSGAFVKLTGNEQIPSGAEVDALNGSLGLTTASGTKAKTQHGVFGGAIFKIVQTKAGANRGFVTLSIVEAAFQGAPSYTLCTSHKAGDASAASLSSRTLQLLHASAHGKFTTRGRYSAATVRGTIWSIADRCDGTLVHDVTDSVAVTDFVRHKTIILHAGQSYLASKP